MPTAAGRCWRTTSIAISIPTLRPGLRDLTWDRTFFAVLLANGAYFWFASGVISTLLSLFGHDRLGLSPAMVHVFESDTLLTPYGAGAGSSRTSVTVMPAAYVAADLLGAKILRIAAHRLGVDARSLTLDGEMVRGAERDLPLREVIQIAYHDVDRLPPGVRDFEPHLAQSVRQCRRAGMDARRDCAQAPRPVINGVHRGDDG